MIQCVRRLGSALLIMLVLGGICMAESTLVSVDTLKNYFDVAVIDATTEELEAFIREYEVTAESVEKYNIPLLLADFVEEFRYEPTVFETMLAYDDARLVVDLQPVDQIVSIAMHEYNEGTVQRVCWDKQTAELSYQKFVVESDEEPVNESCIADEKAVLDWIRPFNEGKWSRLIQGSIVGHKLPYTYLLSIRYADESIAQYYICGEYEVKIPEDMQCQMDAVSTLFE